MPTSGDLAKLRDAGLAVLPEYRLRQPRGFPVAIPRDPTVHLVWSEAELGVHRTALERLGAKVTHVGHSASFVQVWLETSPPASGVDSGNWCRNSATARNESRTLENVGNAHEPRRLDRLSGSSQRN